MYYTFSWGFGVVRLTLLPPSSFADICDPNGSLNAFANQLGAYARPMLCSILIEASLQPFSTQSTSGLAIPTPRSQAPSSSTISFRPHATFTKCLCLTPRPMMAHVVTVALDIASYFYNYTRVGCLVLVLMDLCDALSPVSLHCSVSQHSSR